MSGFRRESIVTGTAVFVLTLMCVAYVPLETTSISPIKVGVSMLAPLVWLLLSPKFSKAFVWAGVYGLVVVILANFTSETMRWSTLLYMWSFIILFIMYYNLIYCERAFTLDYYINFLKRLILAYTICIIVQQFFKIIGLAPFPLINMHFVDPRGVLTVNGLAIEQSHSARIMTVLFLSLLRMYELKWGKENVRISKIYKDDKWVVLGFLWSMLTMGSGTAFVGLAILALYFVKRQYVLTAIPVFIALLFIIPKIEYEPLQRALSTFEAVSTLERDVVIEADGSAAARVVPLINTITNLDITTKEAWIGRGVDAGINEGLWGENRFIGGISDFGLIGYIFSLIFIFRCCIRKVVSVETVVFILLLSAGIINVAYQWGILMLFSTTRYFQDNYNNIKYTQNG